MTSGGSRHRMAWAWGDDGSLHVSQRGRQSRLTDHSLAGAARAGDTHGGAIRAPMAGRIVALSVVGRPGRAQG